jgi:hypothetical protein
LGLISSFAVRVGTAEKRGVATRVVTGPGGWLVLLSSHPGSMFRTYTTMRHKLRRLTKAGAAVLIKVLLDLSDVLMRFADDGSADIGSNATTRTDAAEMAAAIEAAAAAVHIRNSVSLSGWPAETAEALISAGVTAAAADRMLADALRGPVQ